MSTAAVLTSKQAKENSRSMKTAKFAVQKTRTGSRKRVSGAFEIHKAHEAKQAGKSMKSDECVFQAKNETKSSQAQMEYNIACKGNSMDAKSGRLGTWVNFVICCRGAVDAYVYV